MSIRINTGLYLLAVNLNLKEFLRGYSYGSKRPLNSFLRAKFIILVKNLIRIKRIFKKSLLFPCFFCLFV